SQLDRCLRPAHTRVRNVGQQDDERRGQRHERPGGARDHPEREQSEAVNIPATVGSFSRLVAPAAPAQAPAVSTETAAAATCGSGVRIAAPRDTSVVCRNRQSPNPECRREPSTKEGNMGFLAWIVVGLIAGWLAGQVMKGGGYGVVVDILLGMLGGIVGGWIFGQLGIWSGGGMIGSIIVAFVGAVILVWITRLLKKA